jgi:lipoprotein NlpD
MRRRLFTHQESSLWIAVGVLMVAGGCTSAPVPVSERDVADYRKAQPAAAPSSRAAGQSAVPASPESKPPSSGPPTAVNAPKPATAARPAGPSDAGEEVDWRPETYTVKRGDTLYSIALDHGLDYKELAAWNQLADPNVIKVSQQLKLRAPPGWKSGSRRFRRGHRAPAHSLPRRSSRTRWNLRLPRRPNRKALRLPIQARHSASCRRIQLQTPSLEAKPVAAEPKPAAAEPKTEPRPQPREPKALPESKATGRAEADSARPNPFDRHL